MSFPKYCASGMILGADWDALTRNVLNRGGAATAVVGFNSDLSGRENYFLCDGVADDVQIQQAIDYVNGIRGTYYGKVVLDGDFTASSTITVPSFTILEIQGTLTAANGLDTTLIENSDFVGGNTNIEIFGGFIDGNKANQATPTDAKITIHMSNVDNLNIHDLTVVNGWTSAIRTEFCNYVRITNNHIDNPADDCIAINEETSYAIVSENMCLNAGQVVSYGSPIGIEVQDGCHHVSVVGNTVRNPADFGIQVSAHDAKAACYDITIMGNTIHEIGTGAGIQVAANAASLDLVRDVVVSGNVCSKSAVGDTGDGIWIRNAENIEISSNDINENDGLGIRTSESVENLSVVANTIIGNNGSGIGLVAATYCIILGNMVRDNGNQGIQVAPDSSRCFVEGNHCIDNGAALASQLGIAIEGDNNYVINNHCGDTRAGGARTQRYGIYIYNTADGSVLKGNRLYNNSTADFTEDGTNTILPTISGDFPVSNIGGGTTVVAPVINTSPGGVDIDAADEFCYVHIPLPEELQQVVRVKLWAYSNVIEATNNMLLRIVAHGAGSSELWSGNAIDVVNHPSEETGAIVQYDVIHWVIGVSDDAQIGTLAAQDLVELMAVGEGASAPDIATDALFGGWEIEYV